MEIFSGKRDFMKGRPEFPNAISEWEMYVTFARFCLANGIASDRIFREKVVEMEQAHPRENFHLGFDASHLLQLSTNRLFRENGKQPESN